jgi:hypothetical protein
MRMNNEQRLDVKIFLEKVLENVAKRLDIRDFDTELAFQLAIEDEIFKYECPDCMYSIKKGNGV